MNRTRTVALVSASLVVLGAFLPWASIFGASILGIEGDGAITVSLAVVAGLATIFVRSHPRVVGWTNSTAGALVAFIAIIDWTSFAAGGLILTLLAGLSLSGAGVIQLAALRSARA